MFCKEERPESVDLEGLKSFGVVDLGGGFFWVEYSWDAEGEPEVAGREAGFAVVGY